MSLEFVDRGYQGYSSADSFAKDMCFENVDVVVDVRRNAVSRKKGFSKNKLAEVLRSAGVDYLHFPVFGIPSDVRKQHSTVEARQQMLQNYVSQLRTMSKEVAHFIESVQGYKKVCLLCFEEDRDTCHRSKLVSHLMSTN